MTGIMIFSDCKFNIVSGLQAPAGDSYIGKEHVAAVHSENLRTGHKPVRPALDEPHAAALHHAREHSMGK